MHYQIPTKLAKEKRPCILLHHSKRKEKKQLKTQITFYQVFYAFSDTKSCIPPGDYFKHARSLSVIIMLKLTVVVTKFGKQAFTIQGGNNR